MDDYLTLYARFLDMGYSEYTARKLANEATTSNVYNSSDDWE